MRILQLISQTAVGGAERFALELSSELARRGHAVLLAATRSNGPLFEADRPLGLEVAAIHRWRGPDPRVLSRLLGLIHRFRPDLVHSHNFAANTWARLAALSHPGLPLVCHEHSGRKFDRRAVNRWMDRALVCRSDAIIAVSEELVGLLRDVYQVRQDRLLYVPNGIDTERFRPGDPDVRDLHGIVCVASFTPVKNHLILLKAMKHVVAAMPEARLNLVGDGPLRGILEQEVAAAGLTSHVRFLGQRPDVRSDLWRSAIFTLPSKREGMPLSLLEAMACGLPCVVSATGQMDQIVQDRSTGLLVPPGDHERLAAALVDLLRDPARCIRMGAKGRSRVVSLFSLTACADGIEAVYRQIRKARREPDGQGRRPTP